MAQLAAESKCKESSIVFNDNLKRDEEIHSDLEKADKKIQAYVNQQGANSSQPEDWHDNQRVWLHDLRYGYFHFSAKSTSPLLSLAAPHAPNYENGKRQRKTRPG